jgi:ABC-type nitrate/sulfonate/bicarbonate transport system substrate-binding protein
MRRREVLGGAAAALALATAGQPARAATTVTTQLQWIKDVQNAGWWLADADGFFRSGGIDAVELAGGPNVAGVEAVVAAGRADIGVDQLERVVDAIADGSDLVIFGALYQQNPAALLSLPAHPVHTARDLLGKRLGLQQGAKVYIDAIMQLNHLPPNYTEIVVGATPDALLAGACDAYLCFVTNQPLQLAQRGIKSVTATFDQLGYATYTDCLFCTRAYLKANRATVVQYARALRRGWEACARDPARAATLTMSSYGAQLGLDAATELATSRAQIPLLQSAQTRAHGMLWVDTARVAGPIYATLRATGRRNLPPVNRLIDATILRDAAT